uniref:Uncharacterized protein n=1 Tax=Anguilla anguilla TaxID=7936 RepID=A0A0E9Y018_ANGAN
MTLYRKQIKSVLVL